MKYFPGNHTCKASHYIIGYPTGAVGRCRYMARHNFTCLWSLISKCTGILYPLYEMEYKIMMIRKLLHKTWIEENILCMNHAWIIFHVSNDVKITVKSMKSELNTTATSRTSLRARVNWTEIVQNLRSTFKNSLIDSCKGALPWILTMLISSVIGWNCCYKIPCIFCSAN